MKETEYKNFSAQKFYEKFKEEYNKEFKDSNKKRFFSYPFQSWIKEYIRSAVFISFIIIFVADIICSYLFPGEILYRYIIYLWLPIFLLSSIIDYYINFTEEEKIIANFVIDNIVKNEGINNTDTSLDKIIKSSEDIGSREIKLLMNLKGSNIYNYFKSVILTFSGIFMGFISTEISKEGLNKASENFAMLFNLAIQIGLYFVCFYILFYYVFKSINRTKDLYIEVLKDKKLTMELRSK